MKRLLVRPLFLLLAGIGVAASAQHPGLIQVSGDQRNDLRVAVEAHRAARREEVRREEAMAGRRLTAEERAQLREQLRRQWAAHGETAQTAESQPAERTVPGVSLPRIQRH